MGNTAVFRSGSALGRYELLYPIGEGGAGSVWAARMVGFGGFERVVAVKLLHSWLQDDEEHRAALVDEARIAGRIAHPNVVQIVDVGEDRGRVYLVMELVEGITLSALHSAASSTGTEPPIGVVLRILADACAGLHAAHELCDDSGRNLEVVHRDVSPQNILVTTAGTAKIIDFGIAKARGRLQGETQIGSVKGKRRYMAPEQARGGRVDRRADLWAIGAILHLFLTGEEPHRTDSTPGLSPRDAPCVADDPSIPAPLQRILRRALERDPELRYQTAHALREELEAAADALNARATSICVEAHYHACMASERLTESHTRLARAARDGDTVRSGRDAADSGTVVEGSRRGGATLGEWSANLEATQFGEATQFLSFRSILGYSHEDAGGALDGDTADGRSNDESDVPTVVAMGFVGSADVARGGRSVA